MEKVNIILESGIEKEVYSIFYLYDSKYYFIYTEKNIDENGYVILNLVQVGKEIKNTLDGPVDTGYMVGVEIANTEEWKNVQKSITEIVENKKNGTQYDDIKYLPMSMLSKLKIISKKTFRLLKNIIEDSFGVSFESQNELSQPSGLKSFNNINQAGQSIQPSVQENKLLDPIVVPSSTISQILPGEDQTMLLESATNNIGLNQEVNVSNNFLSTNGATYDSSLAQQDKDNIIIDYRAKFFEEQDKSKQLQEQIDILNEKLENIKKVIE